MAKTTPQAASNVSKPKPAAAAADETAPEKPAAKSVSGADKSLSSKIAGAVEAVVDTLTDAERLHHRLDPDPTKDPDPE